MISIYKIRQWQVSGKSGQTVVAKKQQQKVIKSFEKITIEILKSFQWISGEPQIEVQLSKQMSKSKKAHPAFGHTCIFLRSAQPAPNTS